MLRHAPRRARQAAQKQTCNMCTSSESGRRRPAYPREAGSAHGQAGGRRLPAYPRGERPAQPVVKLAAGGWHIPERARVAGSARQAGGRRRRSLHILERREAGSACQAGGGGPRGPPGGGPRGPPGVDGGGPLGSNNSVDAGDARWPSGPGKPPGVMGCKPGGGAPEDGPPPGPCCCCCCCATSIAMILIM